MPSGVVPRVGHFFKARSGSNWFLSNNMIDLVTYPTLSFSCSLLLIFYMIFYSGGFALNEEII